MHGLEIKTLSIEALAALRDDVIALLADKVGGRESEAEVPQRLRRMVGYPLNRGMLEGIEE